MKRKNFLTGQALLELAVFGTILLMLLGVLLNYGLDFSNRQKWTQRTFRNAMASAAVAYNPNLATPMSVSYVTVKDKHIPNPQDPWGIGFVSTVSASASSPMRTNHPEFSPDNINELPRIVISVQGMVSCPPGTVYGNQAPRCQFLAAGFRIEDYVPEDSIIKYRHIYGSVQGCKVPDVSQCPVNNKGKWGALLLSDEEEPDADYVNEALRIACPTNPSAWCYRRIRYIDSAEGEIVDHDSLVKQCRQIVDRRVCREDCRFGQWQSDDQDCASICSAPMAVPWYCANYTEVDTLDHRYVFPVIERMFLLPDAHKAMAIQPDYVKRIRQDNELRKREDNTQIVTRDTWDWNERTDRSIVYKGYRDTSGNANEEPVVTRVYKDETQRWTTPW